MTARRNRLLAICPRSSNPLMRRTDRIESWIRIVVAVACMATVPIACTVGVAVYSAGAEQIRVTNTGKIEVAATIVEGPEALGRDSPVFATARWQQAGGSGTAVVPVSSISSRGDRIRVWLTADGRPTGPPVRGARAVTAGFRAAAAVLLGACGVALLITESARWCATQYQSSRWGEEWHRLDRSVE
ncbi:Rv1733c family protein [Nocardia brasiliensis]|uniref:Rv1733c family protein n=1 Tax=Nocardia brasiliensis TaxID=37326 RepID=UPI003D785C4E